MRRVFGVMACLGLTCSGALAGDLLLRLDQMNYEMRQQRADLDVIRREQALSEVEALGRAARARDEAILEQLDRGPLGDEAPKSAGRYWNFGR